MERGLKMAGDVAFFKSDKMDYYGVFHSDYDKFDPRSDLLTSIRRKYYESDKQRQKNKRVVTVNGEKLRYDYLLDEDLDFKWEVHSSTHKRERAVNKEGIGYRIEINDRSNKLKKKIYFGCYHNWQETHYYNKDPKVPEFRLVAYDLEGVQVILKLIGRETKPTDILYPCFTDADPITVERLKDLFGTPKISALSARGLIYYQDEEISKAWNNLLAHPGLITAKNKKQTVQPQPQIEQTQEVPKIKTEQPKAAHPTQVSKPVQAAHTDKPKKKIDLTQTQEVIIPKVKSNDSVVISSLHTPDKRNISDGKTLEFVKIKEEELLNIPSRNLNAAADKTQSTKKPAEDTKSDADSKTKAQEEEFDILGDEDYEISPEIAKRMQEAIRLAEKQLEDEGITLSDMDDSLLLDYTGEISLIKEESDNTDKTSAIEFSGIGEGTDDSNSSLNGDSAPLSFGDTQLDESEYETENVEPVEFGDTQDQTPVQEPEIKRIPQAERNEEIARRAEKNSFEEVKRAYNLKKVRAATYVDSSEAKKHDMRRTIPIDKIITVSDDEQYYYFGELENNKRNGRGRTVMKNGNTAYDGQYLDDMRNGFGVYYYKTGRICYVGDWERNRRNGVGINFKPSDRTMHVGGWENDCPSGMIAKFDNNGSLVSVSHWESGTKNGIGINCNSDDGSVSVSHWENDVLSNRSAKFDSDGSLVYNGTWLKGKRSGTGTQYTSKGTKVQYTGEWENDRYHGKGTLYLGNGSRIDGEFVNGKVCGFATAYTPNGKKLYEGEWKNNRYDGEGKLYMPSGCWCKGKFSMGQAVGVLDGYSKDGVLLYRGEWQNSRFHGHGICYDNGEKVYEGDLSNGIRTGTGHEYKDGKCIYIGGFKDDVRSGFGTSYDDNGSPVYSGMWNNGEYNGVGLLYVENEPRFAGEFVCGTMDGRINEIFNGKVVKECIYSDGECVYMREYTDDGLSLKYDGNVRNGLYEGMGCGFTVYGEKYFEGIFKKNEPFKNMKVRLRKIKKLEYCDEVSESQYNKFIQAPNYVVEQSYSGGAYSGLMINGKPEGKGTILFDDHGYTGEFSNGAACGLGVIYEWDGSEITGRFVKKANETTSNITFANGITYHIMMSASEAD